MHPTSIAMYIKTLATVIALLLCAAPARAIEVVGPAEAATGSVEDKVRPAEVIERAELGDDGVQRATIFAKRGGYFFSPDRIILKKGIKTELTFFQKGWAFRHHIVMDSPGAGMTFIKYMTEEPRVIIFTPKRTGEFPIWCNAKIFWLYGSHRDRGMEAVIEVVE